MVFPKSSGETDVPSPLFTPNPHDSKCLLFYLNLKHLISCKMVRVLKTCSPILYDLKKKNILSCCGWMFSPNSCWKSTTIVVWEEAFKRCLGHDVPTLLSEWSVHGLIVPLKSGTIINIILSLSPSPTWSPVLSWIPTEKMSGQEGSHQVLTRYWPCAWTPSIQNYELRNLHSL